ncbi:MAG: arsenic resistance protein [Desulfurococcales archaeon]|nr:arsenic resistance protein [Desulfurococcales archaeon]
MVNVKRMASHLRKFLLLYVFLAILLALPLGYFLTPYFKANAGLVKNAILCLAIGTLYPSMIQLKADKLSEEFKSKWKEIAVSLIIIFVIAPAAAMLLAGGNGNKVVGIGYVAANSVPASSASVAYVMLAEGNIELATVLVILSILIALFATPTYVGLYARTVNVSLPIALLAKSVTIALIVPLVLGQLTRYFLVVRKARNIVMDPNVKHECKVRVGTGGSVAETPADIRKAIECLESKLSARLKPVLSIWTMTFMLALIFLLIANKAVLLISKPTLAGYIIGAQLVVYGLIIASLLVASKVLKMSFEDHMGVAFIAITKNESVAAAMAVLTIGSAAAIPAALIPSIQPVIAILYVSAAPIIRKLLKGM